jgi:hypothetical protein
MREVTFCHKFNEPAEKPPVLITEVVAQYEVASFEIHSNLIYEYDIYIYYTKIMGIAFIDNHTFGHLFGGILSFTMLQYSNVPLSYNFMIANGIHYMIERREKSVAPNGRVLETYQNHIGDIIAFFSGWMIAYALRLDRYVNHKIAPLLWVVLIYNYSTEILREMYPYERRLDGAYTKDK